MSEPIHEFLVNSTVTLVITIFTGLLVVCGLLFQIGWHVSQRMKSKYTIPGKVVEGSPSRQDSVEMTMVDLKTDMRSFHERMNKQEHELISMKNDLTTIKEAVLKLTDALNHKQ